MDIKEIEQPVKIEEQEESQQEPREQEQEPREQEEEQEEEQEQETSFDMNDITMKFLMNKGNYDKYVVQNHPDKMLDQNEFVQELQKYKKEILDITEAYINDIHTDINPYITESFQMYVKNIIKYSKHREIISMNQFNHSEHDNNDTIFTNIDNELLTKSYWSKERIIKKR